MVRYVDLIFRLLLINLNLIEFVEWKLFIFIVGIKNKVVIGMFRLFGGIGRAFEKRILC